MMPNGYDYEYVKTLLENLGEEGRQLYLTRQLPLDIFYPICFGMSGWIALVLLFRKLKISDLWYYLAALPILAMIFDYAENAGIYRLLMSFPNLPDTTVEWVNTFTLIKSYSTAAFWLTLIGALLVWGWKSIIMKD